MLVGLGYDVHRFKKKRPLILGGVRIKYKKGLEGHSDADVLIHALMDAVLGAAGLNDIGTYFPDTEPRYKNASSVALLKKVKKIISSKKLAVNNADITVIAEEPKIRPYMRQIKRKISNLLDIPSKRIGIKATTNEKLGFIGRGEGIAAIAIASLKLKTS